MSNAEKATDLDVNEIKETTEINQARAMVYQLLSSLFAWEITEKRLKELTSPEAQIFWKGLAQEPEFTPEVNILLSTLMQITTERQRLELAADFCSLFLIGGKNNSSPYASLFLSEEAEPTLYGELHQRMSEFLKQSNLQIQADFKEPADHLAVMLAYMGHLCTHSSTDTQQTYLKVCITSWLPLFAQKVFENDRNNASQFYSALVRLTQKWIAGELLISNF